MLDVIVSGSVEAVRSEGIHVVPLASQHGLQSPHSSPRRHILQVNSMAVVDTDPFCPSSIHSFFWQQQIEVSFGKLPDPHSKPMSLTLLWGSKRVSLNPSLGNESIPFWPQGMVQGGVSDSMLMRCHPRFLREQLEREALVQQTELLRDTLRVLGAHPAGKRIEPECKRSQPRER